MCSCLRKYFKSFKVECPKTLNTRKSRAAFIFFRWWYAFELGKNQIFGRIMSFVPEIAGVLIIFKFAFKFEPNQIQTIIAIPLVIITCLLLGKWWENHNLDRIQSMVSIERNQFQRDVHKLIEKQKRDKL